MALYLDGASTQYLRNSSPPITDYPLSVGMWVRLAGAGTVGRVLFTLTDTGTTNNYLRLQMSAGELVQQSAAAGGTGNTQTSAAGSNLSSSGWAFAVARFISSTERRTSIWNPAATSTPFSSISTTADRAPTGMDTMLIGAGETSAGVEEPWDGGIAEFWLASGDVGNSGTDLTQAEVVQLALGGPFSSPRVACRVVDYRSFQNGIDSSSDELGQVDGLGKRQAWATAGGSLIRAAHPPLPYWFVRPGQTQRVVIV